MQLWSCLMRVETTLSKSMFPGKIMGNFVFQELNLSKDHMGWNSLVERKLREAPGKLAEDDHFNQLNWKHIFSCIAFHCELSEVHSPCKRLQLICRVIMKLLTLTRFALHYSFLSRKFHWRKKVDRSQRMQAKPYQLWISLFKPSVVAIFSPIGVFPYPWLFPISNTHQPLNQKIWIIAITGSPLAFLFLWI